MEPQTEADPVTGKRITEALMAQLEDSGEPLSRTVLVPSVFRVYLHPRDWERLYPILHEVRTDAESELSEALEKLNKPVVSLAARYGFRKAKPFRRVKEYWQIDIYPNRDENCAPGEFIIVSDFPEPAKAAEFEGTETVRATRFRTDKGTGATTSEGMEQSRRLEGIYAQICFADDLGRRSYLMTRNEVHIGRGGVGRWVDIELRTEIPDISREHVIIRRTDAGTFEIKDVSKFGTAVNGVAVPPSKVTENGAEIDKDLWAALKPPARIVLAGRFDLDFQESA